jgi:hypothetical protein
MPIGGIGGQQQVQGTGSTQATQQSAPASFGGKFAKIAKGFGRVMLGIATLGISEAVIKGVQSYKASQSTGAPRMADIINPQQKPETEVIEHNNKILKDLTSPKSEGHDYDYIDLFIASEKRSLGINTRTSDIPKGDLKRIYDSAKLETKKFIEDNSRSGGAKEVTMREAQQAMKKGVRLGLMELEYEKHGVEGTEISRSGGKNIDFDSTVRESLTEKFKSWAKGDRGKNSYATQNKGPEGKANSLPIAGGNSQKVPEGDHEMHEILSHIDQALVKDMPRAIYKIGGEAIDKSDTIASVKAFANLFRGSDGKIDYKAMQVASSILSQKGDAGIVTDPAVLGETGLPFVESSLSYHSYSIDKDPETGAINLTIKTQNVPRLNHNGSVSDVSTSDSFYDYSAQIQITPSSSGGEPEVSVTNFNLNYNLD